MGGGILSEKFTRDAELIAGEKEKECGGAMACWGKRHRRKPAVLPPYQESGPHQSKREKKPAILGEKRGMPKKDKEKESVPEGKDTRRHLRHSVSATRP